MLTSQFEVLTQLQRESVYPLFQPRRALPPDEPMVETPCGGLKPIECLQPCLAPCMHSLGSPVG
jgi:hypothetical protein